MLANLLLRLGNLQPDEMSTPISTYGENLGRIKYALTWGKDLKALRRGHLAIHRLTASGHEASGIGELAGWGAKTLSSDPVGV